MAPATNVPFPALSSVETVNDPALATAKSGTESPLKSADVNEVGAAANGIIDGRKKLPAAGVQQHRNVVRLLVRGDQIGEIVVIQIDGDQINRVGADCKSVPHGKRAVADARGSLANQKLDGAVGALGDCQVQNLIVIEIGRDNRFGIGSD